MWVGVDGTWDPNFNVPVSSGSTAFVQTNGQILVGGDHSVLWPGGGTRSRILRLNPDGSLDSSFDPGSGSNGLVKFVWGQPDGKVIINGDFSIVRDYSRNKFARLMPDGTLDLVFAQSNWLVAECLTQPDGKLLVRTQGEGERPCEIFRLNIDWTDDPTFPRLSFRKGGSLSQPLSFCLQDDGKLVVAGAFDEVRRVSPSGTLGFANRIVRINCDNPVPLRFLNQPQTLGTTIEGTGFSLFANAVGFPPPAYQWQFDGVDIPGATNTALVIERVAPSHSGTYRLVASNALETILSDPYLLAVILKPRIVTQPESQSVPIGGTFSALVQATGTEPLQYQWTRDGAALSGETNSNLTITNVLANHGGVYSVVVANLAGSVVSTTATLTVLFPPSIYLQPLSQTVFIGSPVVMSVAASGDGPISYQWWLNDASIPGATNAVMHLAATQAAATGTYRVVVSNPYGSLSSAAALLTVLDQNTQVPGSLDPTFDPRTDVFGRGPGWPGVHAVSLGSDGRMIAAAAQCSRKLVRLEPHGTLDDSFRDVPAGEIGAVCIQPDGRVLIGLDRYFVDGSIARHGIARLRADGLVDRTFLPTYGLQWKTDNVVACVLAIGLQLDSKVVLGGYFTTVNSKAQRGIARLNPDATSDTNFLVGSGVDYRVLTLVVQPDSKIIAGGEFSSIAGSLRSGIARLNADGSPDLGFDPGWGVDDSVRAIALQPDGKVLIAGAFTTFDLERRNRVARLNPDGSLDHTFDPQDGPDGDVFSMAYQADGKIVIGGAFTSERFSEKSKGDFAPDKPGRG